MTRRTRQPAPMTRAEISRALAENQTAIDAAADGVLDGADGAEALLTRLQQERAGMFRLEDQINDLESARQRREQRARDEAAADQRAEAIARIMRALDGRDAAAREAAQLIEALAATVATLQEAEGDARKEAVRLGGMDLVEHISGRTAWAGLAGVIVQHRALTAMLSAIDWPFAQAFSRPGSLERDLQNQRTYVSSTLSPADEPAPEAA